jgi:hypothetical protein
MRLYTILLILLPILCQDKADKEKAKAEKALKELHK